MATIQNDGRSDESQKHTDGRASCSTDVNRLLFEFVGAQSLDAANENEMLTHIRSVAVKGTHKEVHRMNFSKLNQMEGETISQFVARLKSQASLCQFNITCNAHDPPKKLSYADDMVTQQLIAGLGNQQHQSRVLAEATTLITLAAEIARLHCLESTEESTTQMRNQPANQTIYPGLKSHGNPTTADSINYHPPTKA